MYVTFFLQLVHVIGRWLNVEQISNVQNTHSGCFRYGLFFIFLDYYNSPGLIFQWTRSTLLVISPIHTCHVLIMCISGPCITKHCNTSIVSSFRCLWSSSKPTILIFLASEPLVCLSLSSNQ